MRNFLTLPAIAAAIIGLQSSVHSRPLTESSLTERGESCSGPQCPADSGFLIARAPGAGFHPGEPHGSGHGDGASDPSSSSGSGGQDPGTTPARLGTGDGASGGSGQHGANDPARIASGGSGATGAGRDNPPLIGESKDYGTLVTKGGKVDDETHTAIKNNDKDQKLPPLTDHYAEDKSTGQTLHSEEDKDLLDPLAKAGISDTTKVKYSSSIVKSKDAPRDAGLVAKGKFYDQDGIIIGEERFASNDINKGGDVMRPSDILWSQYSAFASHYSPRTKQIQRGMTDDVNKLKAFVGRDIQSRSAVETINTAHTKTNQDVKQPGVFRRSDTSDGGKEAFKALLGTDSLSSVNYMLKDHHDAVGNKVITEIHTYPRDFDANTNPKGRKKVAIVAKLDVVTP